MHVARLGGVQPAEFNARLLAECRQLLRDDAAGRAWSRTNYPGGYTSYASVTRLHRLSPTFADLERRLDDHVRPFARALRLDLRGHALAMTDCWVNVMGPGGAHGLHLHPISTLSGTYYVRVPRGAPGLKLEDPRLDRMMAAPPRRRGARDGRWFEVAARTGYLIVFESWLRHEVPPQRAAGQRVSVSFNYSWF